MKKYVLAAVFSLAILVSPVFIHQVNAADLTNSRIQAVLSLLSSFGADPRVIANVTASLQDSTQATPTNCVDFSAQMTSGSTDATTGGDVTRLQNFLTQTGDYKSPITGYYGSLTETAIQKYQAAHNIVSSGTPDTTGYGAVGPTTRAALDIACSSQTSDATASSSESTTTTSQKTSLVAAVNNAFSGGGTNLSISVSGNRLLDARGKTVQLRGANFSGMEFVAIQGWSPSDPTGGQGGQPGGPNFAAMKSWGINVVRIPLNEASWLGYSCTDTSGVVHNPDPGNNYRSTLQKLVSNANAQGMYVIIDLHWTAPGTMCPMLQTQFADADHSLAFWTSIANTYKNNPSVLFELFNEPFFNFDFTGNEWTAMMKGTGGSFSGYPATSGSGNWKDIKTPWQIASYQAMINAVRATGAHNVVLVGTMQYDQKLSGWLANKPSDPLGQMAAAWHPYRLYNSAWNYPYPNFNPEVFTDARNILNAGIPLVMTETGGQNTPGTPNSPIVTTMTNFADTYGASVLGWAWDVWPNDPENVLIKDVNGTPTDGYGRVFKAWLQSHI